jgi:hypothetical protein
MLSTSQPLQHFASVLSILGLAQNDTNAFSDGVAG